jgi:hypothetical protein
MTTITIERAVLLRALEALRPATAPNGAKRDAAFEELRAALAAPATAPAQPERKHTEAEVDEWVAAFLKCSTNGEFREEARRILGVSHG